MNNIFLNFRESIIEIMKETLGTEDGLTFNKDIGPSQNLLDISNKNKFLVVEANIVGPETAGSISFLIPAKLSLSIEYFMLMGQTTFDKELVITEATVDAVQELLQMILKKTSNNLENQKLGKFKMGIANAFLIDSTIDLDLNKYEFYNSYHWTQELNDIRIDDDAYILFDAVTNILFKEEEPKKNVNPVVQIHEDNRDEEVDENNITIEITDCDNRKKIYRNELDNLKLLLGIELKLSVRIGRKKMLLKDVVNLDIGKTIELEQLATEPLEILVNEIKIADGEIVVVDGKFGIQITNISTKVERLTKLRYKV
jgi:flagellar motor switch protein FliN/FliY